MCCATFAFFDKNIHEFDHILSLCFLFCICIYDQYTYMHIAFIYPANAQMNLEYRSRINVWVN